MLSLSVLVGLVAPVVLAQQAGYGGGAYEAELQRRQMEYMQQQQRLRQQQQVRAAH
jgi:hypothetical protein